MKAKLIALGAASLLALCACSSTSADDESAKVILLGNEPQNVQPVILLQHQTTGKLACCRDTGEVTAPLERERKSAEVVAHAVTGEHRRF